MTPSNEPNIFNRRFIFFCLAIIGILSTLLFLAFIVINSQSSSDSDHSIVGKMVAYPGRTINYDVEFNQLNPTHLSAATKVGLSSRIATRKEVSSNKKSLVKISDNKNYILDKLTHSLPFLCKNSARELDSIAADFADILERNDLPHYKLIVTSVLRTEEDVRNLQTSGNVNASFNSAHCYATTFDITYARFEKANPFDSRSMHQDNLKLVLAQALLNEKRKGHIYVKYEKKQACFHITSRL